MKTFRAVDLNIVETQALIDEMVNRYDALVVIGWKNLGEGKSEQLTQFNGSRHLVMGLVHEAEVKLPYME